MNQYLVPTDEKFVESVAKSIAKERLRQQMISALDSVIGIQMDRPLEVLDSTIDTVFDTLWYEMTPTGELQRRSYISDARAAISAINLNFLITPD